MSANQKTNLEPAAISKLRAWKNEQATEINRRNIALSTQLQAVVPENFKRWLEEDGNGVISSLLKYDTASRKYYRNKDCHLYGYIDLDEFARRFNELKTAWQNVVDISIVWDGDNRFEVIFQAV